MPVENHEVFNMGKDALASVFAFIHFILLLFFDRVLS